MIRPSFPITPTALALTAAAIITIPTGANADGFSWPGWRGADRNDRSAETGLLQEWPEGGPERAWLFDDAGMGYAGFSIADGKLFTMGSYDGVACLLCVNAENGEEIWRSEVTGYFTNKWGNGPRGTPAIDGDHVYALFAKGELICANVEDGEIVWQVNLVDDLGGKVPGWGYAESPLVDGDHILVTPGGRGGAIAALDKASGEVVWRTEDFTDGAQYSSIVAAEIGGQRQYVQLVSKAAVGVDAESGEVLWRTNWEGKTAVIPTPVVDGDQVFITSGYGVGCKLIEISGAGAEDVWQNEHMINHHGGVVLVDGHLYGFSDGRGLTCLDWEGGDVAWEDKTYRKGAVHYADGRLYCLEENSGNVALIGATADGFEQHGAFTLDPQTEQRAPSGKIWVHPVVCNGRLYLRDQEYIYCYDISAN